MTARDEVRARIRGLYGIADATARGTAEDDLEGLVAAMLEGGCRLVQLRCKDWPADEVLAVARRASARCRAVGATFLVNDHAEIAVAADADGVHVGQLDAAPEAVRRIVGPDRIVGRSTNDLDQLRAALVGADYVAYGPVWPTPNAGRPKTVRGPEALAQARLAVPAGFPLVAIGGITAERVPIVRAAGVDAWAVIGAIANAEDPVAATRALR